MPGPSSIPREMPHPPQQHDQARRRSVGSAGSSSAYSGKTETRTRLKNRLSPAKDNQTRKKKYPHRASASTGTRRIYSLAPDLQFYPWMWSFVIYVERTVTIWGDFGDDARQLIRFFTQAIRNSTPPQALILAVRCFLRPHHSTTLGDQLPNPLSHLQYRHPLPLENSLTQSTGREVACQYRRC